MQCSFDPPLADSSSCHPGVCQSLHMMPFADFSGSEPTLHNVSAEIGHMLHTKGTRKPFTHALHKREVKKILWWHVLDVLQARSVNAHCCAAHTRTATSDRSPATSQSAHTGWAGNLHAPSD